MAECYPEGQKTSNFSFSHSVLKKLLLQTRKNQGLFGKGLTMVGEYMPSFPGAPTILYLCMCMEF